MDWRSIWYGRLNDRGEDRGEGSKRIFGFDGGGPFRPGISPVVTETDSGWTWEMEVSTFRLYGGCGSPYFKCSDSKTDVPSCRRPFKLFV